MLKFKVDYVINIKNEKCIFVAASDEDKNFSGNCAFLIDHPEDLKKTCEKIQLSVNELMEHYYGKPFVEDRLHESVSE